MLFSSTFCLNKTFNKPRIQAWLCHSSSSIVSSDDDMSTSDFKYGFYSFSPPYSTLFKNSHNRHNEAYVLLMSLLHCWAGAITIWSYCWWFSKTFFALKYFPTHIKHYIIIFHSMWTKFKKNRVYQYVIVSTNFQILYNVTRRVFQQ